MKPRIHEGVTVRLPHSRHPSMPQGHGVITAVHGDTVDVETYASELVSKTTVRVPHEDAASKTSGWWRYTYPRGK